RFHIIHDLLHYAALDADRLSQPIDILPLQAKHLGDAKPEADGQEQHRARTNIFAKSFHEGVKLFGGEASRFSKPPVRSFYAYKLHRITLRRHVSSPHRVIPQD